MCNYIYIGGDIYTKYDFGIRYRCYACIVIN